MFKKLLEERATLQEEMAQIVQTAETEERAVSEEESARFDEIEKRIDAINKTIKLEERSRSITNNVTVPRVDNETVSDEEMEERAFEHYIRGYVVEERATAVNLTKGDNGAVIPSSIANKIIETVYDISPIFQMATRYNIGGTLSIPYYDESTQAITAAYADEFTNLTSTAGKFQSIELKGYLSGVLSLVSESLINNSQFDILSFVVKKMAEAIAKFVEKELINGTTNKVTGLSSGITQIKTAAATTTFTSDELIDLQEMIPDVFTDCVWMMNKSTRITIRKFKDSDGNYLLNRDVSARWGYTLLGKDVYTTDSISAIAAEKDVILYGDMSGLAVKLSEEVNVKVLREAFAIQHAIGVVGWIEFDAKVENAQKLAKLTMKAAT